MDQLQLDYQITSVIPNAIPGTTYIIYGKQYLYKGSDKIHEQSMVLMRDHPEMFDAAAAYAMIKDPLGYKKPPCGLDPKIIAGLAAVKTLGKLSDMTGLGSKLGLPSPAGLVSGVISKITNALPTKALGPGGIAVPGQIAAVKTALDAALKGPTSAIAMAMKSNLLSDVAAAAGTAANVVSLASKVGALAAAAGNPKAFASAADAICRQFPMMNVNAIAGNMIAGVLTGKGFDIASKIPNLNLSPDGLMKMLPVPGKLPTMNATNPIKTAAPPKPVQPVELKNLFAEGAAAGSVSDLTKPLSQAMGIASTIASAVNSLSHSPAVTSYGTQKLVGNANTVNWGSGGYGRDNTWDLHEQKRMALSSKIEIHTKELDTMVEPYHSKLYSMSYPELTKKYPRIKPTTPVAEALQIIREVEEAAIIINRIL
jgi:hypothetical protein